MIVFLEKLKICVKVNSKSRIIPFLLVDTLNPDALTKLKNHGVVVGFVKDLFGEKYALALRELVAILENAGASLKTSPDKYIALINQLKTYNEALLNNIKGSLFEFAVGHIHSKSCQSITIGREITSLDSRHEMDVFAVYQDKIVVAECKATISLVDEEMIERWLSIKIPAFREYIKSQDAYKDKDLYFEYWSCSGFMPDALSELETAKNKINKYRIEYYSDKSLLKHPGVIKDTNLKNILKEFFIGKSV